MPTSCELYADMVRRSTVAEGIEQSAVLDSSSVERLQRHCRMSDRVAFTINASLCSSSNGGLGSPI